MNIIKENLDFIIKSATLAMEHGDNDSEDYATFLHIENLAQEALLILTKDDTIIKFKKNPAWDLL